MYTSGLYLFGCRNIHTVLIHLRSLTGRKITETFPSCYAYPCILSLFIDAYSILTGIFNTPFQLENDLGDLDENHFAPSSFYCTNIFATGIRERSRSLYNLHVCEEKSGTLFGIFW